MKQNETCMFLKKCQYSAVNFHREKMNTIQRKQDLISIDHVKHLAFLYHLQLAV